MPEMPEVEIIRRYLDKMAAGKKIMDLDIRLPRMIKWPDTEGFRALVTGRTIKAMNRRGERPATLQKEVVAAPEFVTGEEDAINRFDPEKKRRRRKGGKGRSRK